jgi:hypothetical protein
MLRPRSAEELQWHRKLQTLNADHNLFLIDQATKTFENALRREGMLD